MTKIDTFEIPTEIAQNLTNLMTNQAINDRILSSVADQPEKYKAVMADQIKIQREIDALKYKITSEFVPDQYRFEQYSWNYNGIDVAGNEVEIMENN